MCVCVCVCVCVFVRPCTNSPVRTHTGTGRTEGVAEQLEATATLLDPRHHYSGHPRRPPTLTRPAYTPPLLTAPARHAHNSTSQQGEAGGEARDIYAGFGSHESNWIPGHGDLPGLDGATPLNLVTQVTVLVDGCATPPNYLMGVVRQAVGAWAGVGVMVGVAEAHRAEVEDVSNLQGVELITVGGGAGGVVVVAVVWWWW